MLRQAAQEHGIDLANSIMVGDSERDVVAGRAVGCRTVLLLSGHTDHADLSGLASRPDFVANDLAEATERIISACTD
jgi:phosphoglycolate phosphatase-like HAD superfamily hydrolase